MVFKNYYHFWNEIKEDFENTKGVSSDNFILYRYVAMEKDSTMMMDILVFLLTISYCTGMY